jgi:hypothetical protein
MTGTRKTDGLDPKVPIQAFVTILVAALAYFGVDLDPEVAGAIGIVLGAIAAIAGPAAKTFIATK